MFIYRVGAQIENNNSSPSTNGNATECVISKGDRECIDQSITRDTFSFQVSRVIVIMCMPLREEQSPRGATRQSYPALAVTLNTSQGRGVEDLACLATSGGGVEGLTTYILPHYVAYIQTSIAKAGSFCILIYHIKKTNNINMVFLGDFQHACAIVKRVHSSVWSRFPAQLWKELSREQRCACVHVAHAWIGPSCFPPQGPSIGGCGTRGKSHCGPPDAFKRNREYYTHHITSKRAPPPKAPPPKARGPVRPPRFAVYPRDGSAPPLMLHSFDWSCDRT